MIDLPKIRANLEGAPDPREGGWPKGLVEYGDPIKDLTALCNEVEELQAQLNKKDGEASPQN